MSLFHPDAGLSVTESGVSTYGALYTLSLALEVHRNAQFPPIADPESIRSAHKLGASNEKI